MIWNSSQPETAIQALAEYMAAEMQPATAGADNACRVRELAAAVATFVQEQHPQWTARGGSGLPSEYLTLLLSRALWSVGEERMARRLFEGQPAGDPARVSFIEAALAPDLSVLHWQVMLERRAIRPALSSAACSGTLWLLDLERMLAPTALELTAMAVLRQTVDRVAPVWDGAGGQGMLGLRGARRALAKLLGCSWRDQQCASLTTELRRFCGLRLQQLKNERHWWSVPDVLLLDL